MTSCNVALLTEWDFYTLDDNKDIVFCVTTPSIEHCSSPSLILEYNCH